MKIVKHKVAKVEAQIKKMTYYAYLHLLLLNST